MGSCVAQVPVRTASQNPNCQHVGEPAARHGHEGRRGDQPGCRLPQRDVPLERRDGRHPREAIVISRSWGTFVCLIVLMADEQLFLESHHALGHVVSNYICVCVVCCWAVCSRTPLVEVDFVGVEINQAFMSNVAEFMIQSRSFDAPGDGQHASLPSIGLKFELHEANTLRALSAAE